MGMTNYKHPSDTVTQILRATVSSLRRGSLIPVLPPITPALPSPPPVTAPDAMRDENGTRYSDEFSVVWVW